MRRARLSTGTKSLLFGAHQFLWHPVCVALAWRKLKGSFPVDPRIWLAFVVHDWGYWGCPDMDGEDGKMHPWRAARWFTRWFDWGSVTPVFEGGADAAVGRVVDMMTSTAKPPVEEILPLVMDVSRPGHHLGPWGRFCLFHSRSLARYYGEPVSDLCGPDKIASFMVPRWVYLTGCRWSGELEEYMSEADTPAGRTAGIDSSSPEAWFDSVKLYLDGVASGIARGEDHGVPPSRTPGFTPPAQS